MGVAQLQRIERPAHRRAPVGQAPLALTMLQRHRQSRAAVVGIDRQVVRVENVRFMCGEAVHRTDQTIAVERTDRHAALADRGDQHVDRDQLARVAPHPLLEHAASERARQRCAARETRSSSAQDLDRLGHRFEERAVEGDTRCPAPDGHRHDPVGGLQCLLGDVAGIGAAGRRGVAGIDEAGHRRDVDVEGPADRRSRASRRTTSARRARRTGRGSASVAARPPTRPTLRLTTAHAPRSSAALDTRRRRERLVEAQRGLQLRGEDGVVGEVVPVERLLDVVQSVLVDLAQHVEIVERVRRVGIDRELDRRETRRAPPTGARRPNPARSST